jgi:phage shock protein A
MSNENNGSVWVGAFFVILVLGAAFYFFSAPFKSKVDEGVKQATVFTPENIQKDPINYLNWSTDEIQKSMDKLGAARISMMTKKGAVLRQLQDDQSELEGHRSFFSDAKAAYIKASADSEWPVTIRGFKLTESQTKDRILEASDRISDLENRIVTQSNLISTLESQISRLDTSLTEFERAKREIQVQTDVVKIEREEEKQKAMMDNVNALLIQAGALTTSPQAPSLHQLTAPNASEVKDRKFESIMNK